MKALLTYIAIFLITCSLASQSQSPIYSFFSAGHTYGNPINFQHGLHPPFEDYINNVNDYPNMILGFLTGDVVPIATPAYWDAAQADIDKLNMPVHIAAGNHDIGDEFVNRFEDYFFSLVQNSDLFIVLTPGLDDWNISGEQLEFLTNTLDDNYTLVNNIFIFLHELIWWSPVNKYNVIDINFEPHFPGSTNFDDVVKPLLLSYPNPITIYAGDLGATEGVSPFMYDKFDNITLIGSGMGGGIRDNIIITDVYEDSVRFKLVAINGEDPNKLGDLTDHIISSITPPSTSYDIRMYPNPSSNHFYLENNTPSLLHLNIYNIFGQLVKSDMISEISISEILTSEFTPGLYIVLLVGENIRIEKKLVVE